MTKIASFYKDTFFYIETTRRLVTACCTPTTAWQQRDMLIKRGVPASVREISSVAEMHGLVDSGRRPIIIGVLMSKVPSMYRDHPFLGWHALCVLKGDYYNGTRGFWINDPNFSPAGGIRPDPDRGRKWYPDWVIQNAYINNSPRYSVVPNSAKAVTAPAPTQEYVKFNAGVNGINLRLQPDSRLNNIYAVVYTDPKGIVRVKDGARIGATSSRRTVFGRVRGPDGQDYIKLRLMGTGVYQYVQSRFLHRV
ncbi:MAG: hypothetical protein H0W24_02430 [Lysobacter sp.]|nr:hypothetical protein [Lysobacter sp.]